MPSLRSALLHLLEEFKNIRELKKIHTQIIKSPFLSTDDQAFLITRLLFFSAISDSDSGSHRYAAHVFRAIKDPNLYVYNVMIRAYACTKISSEDETLSSFGSLLLYKQMLCDDISPNCLTFPFLVK